MIINKIDFDVIIPTFNRINLITRAIESIDNQSLIPKKIIIVDDGSTDGTKDLFSNDDRYLYIYQNNRGGASARNKGLLFSESEWIAFLDSDDIWEKNHLEKISNAILKTNGSAVLYFQDMMMNTNGEKFRLWEKSGFTIKEAVTLINNGTEIAFLDYQPMMLQSSVINRLELNKIGKFNEDLLRRHDTDLFFKLSIGKKICAVDGIGAKMLNDDNKNRLTEKWNNNAEVYLKSSIYLYKNVLSKLNTYKKNEYYSYKKITKKLLAIYYLKYSKIKYKRNDYKELLINIFFAIKTSFFYSFERLMKFIIKKNFNNNTANKKKME